ncbi:hypothetical protein QLL95_gp1304 [Cotonvirus japonicus]|uniref:Uncharacterized protein n=1 Tax=Cotonvirus japonicus TaxID=2811091 RepID=A0ABM7NRP5_9VIRU|nr:hypothetical protein QLL95_gp1304 [Cotonvirus japonicus]BCS82819.1 hypothetical protein [Cotonvirus japonicus]
MILPEFNLLNIVENSSIYINGARGTGKTKLAEKIISLLNDNRSIDKIYIYTCKKTNIEEEYKLLFSDSKTKSKIIIRNDLKKFLTEINKKIHDDKYVLEFESESIFLLDDPCIKKNQINIVHNILKSSDFCNYTVILIQQQLTDCFGMADYSFIFGNIDYNNLHKIMYNPLPDKYYKYLKNNFIAKKYRPIVYDNGMLKMYQMNYVLSDKYNEIIDEHDVIDDDIIIFAENNFVVPKIYLEI